MSLNEVDEDLLVEVGAVSEVQRWLQADRVHNQRDELGHPRVYMVLVQLVHQNHNDRQLLQHLQGQNSLGNKAVAKVANSVRGFLRLHRGDREASMRRSVNVQL